jgi:hypothetical protein
MRYLAIFFFFGCVISLKAQENLIPNPSFEDTISCPTSLAQINNAKYWSSPTWGSPDYYNECSLNENVDIPKNLAGFQYAHTGQAYSGLVSICINCLNTSLFREYLQVKLNQPLIAMKKYKVEFFVSLADSSKYATKNIGAFISQDSISIPTTENIAVVPIINYSGDFISDTLNWSVVEGSFFAIGDEQYLIIGNFKNDIETDTLVFDSINSQWTGAYYYIDDVSVTLDTTTGISETEKQNLNVYPNPATTEIIVSGYGPVYLKLCDAVGQTVAESTSNKVSVAHLSQGLYVLQLFDAKGQQVKIEKVIIEY